MWIILSLFPLLLSSCTLGPDYQQPGSPAKAIPWSASEQRNLISSESLFSEDFVEQEWWHALKDPSLTDLIDQSLQHNRSLEIALNNVRQARLQYEITFSVFFPKVNASTDFQRHRRSSNNPLLPGIDEVLPGGEPELLNNTFSAGFDASYEIDLFGKNRRSVEAAAAELEAIGFSQREILISVLAEVGRQYALLRGGQNQLAITKENIRLQAETLRIAIWRNEVGEGNQFEIARAEAELKQTRARLPIFEAQISASAYALSYLSGQPPAELLDRLLREEPMPSPPELVGVGLPFDLLRRRPDVISAERYLAATTANIGVATAELYPSVSLTSRAGLASNASDDLLDWVSRTWLINPQIRMPIFNAGALRKQVDFAELQAENAFLSWEDSVLNALREAETALARYAGERDRATLLQEAVQASHSSANLAAIRYEAGEDSLVHLIDAQRQHLANRSALSQAQQSVLIELVSLYKALGGGWDGTITEIASL